MCSVQFLSFNPECLDNAWHFVGRHHGLNMKMPSLPPSGSDVWILSHQLGGAILGGRGNSWRVGQLRVTGCQPLKKTLGSWFLPSTLNLHHKILLHDILPLNTLGNMKPSDQEWNPSETLNPPKNISLPLHHLQVFWSQWRKSWYRHDRVSHDWENERMRITRGVWIRSKPVQR